ncbi:hypothetical protein, partial [Salmonella enterica]
FHDFENSIENHWWEKTSFIKNIHQIEEKKRLELSNENNHDDTYLQKHNDLKQLGIAPYSLPDTDFESVKNLRMNYENTDEFDEEE